MRSCPGTGAQAGVGDDVGRDRGRMGREGGRREGMYVQFRLVHLVLGFPSGSDGKDPPAVRET